MIDDSVPWKEELVKVADRLAAKSKQKRWTDRTGYLIERDFMVSAYAIRKLLEAHKISDRLRLRQFSVERFNLIGEPPDVLTTSDIAKSYDLAHPRKITLPLDRVCNQIVHSFVLTFACNETTDLFEGIYVSSTYDKDRHLHLIRAADYIALCRGIGSEDVYSISYNLDESGRLQVTEVLGWPSDELVSDAGF